jgi:hypothetical protein
MLVVQEHYNNEYRKQDIISAQVFRATVVLSLALGAVLALAIGGWFVFAGEVGDTVRLAMLFGLLGGALSVAVSFLQREPGRIPKLMREDLVTLARPVIGAGTATAVYLYLLAGLLSVEGLREPWAVSGLAFLAGFSERWFLGIVAASEQKTAKNP